MLPSITMSLTSRLLPDASPGWRGGGAGGSSKPRPLARQELGLRAGPAGCRGWSRRSKPGADRLGGGRAGIAGGHDAKASGDERQLPARHGRIQACRFLAGPATGARTVLRFRLPHQRPGAGVEEHRSAVRRRRSDPGSRRPRRGQRPVGRGRQAAAAAAGEAGAGATAGCGAAVAQQAAGVEEHAGRQLQVRAEIGLQAADQRRWSCPRPGCRPRSRSGRRRCSPRPSPPAARHRRSAR